MSHERQKRERNATNDSVDSQCRDAEPAASKWNEEKRNRIAKQNEMFFCLRTRTSNLLPLFECDLPTSSSFDWIELNWIGLKPEISFISALIEVCKFSFI